MKVIYTCIFGNYDDLKRPAILSNGWRYICYTDQPLISDVWEVIYTPVPADIDPRRYARWFKIMHWIDWQYSIWIDASFQININLDTIWNRWFKSPFACALHPLRRSIYHECRSCIANYRGDNAAADIALIENQWRKYIAAGVPEYEGKIITSGILLRENTQPCIQLHEAWYKELSEQSARDQLAFAFVSLGLDWINTYQWDYTQSKEFKYIKHLNLR